MIITNGTGDVGQDTCNVADEDVEELDESRGHGFIESFLAVTQRWLARRRSLSDFLIDNLFACVADF
jgi:hypothetical protein